MFDNLYENEFTFGRSSASNTYGSYIDDEFDNRLTINKEEFNSNNLSKSRK